MLFRCQEPQVVTLRRGSVPKVGLLVALPSSGWISPPSSLLEFLTPDFQCLCPCSTGTLVIASLGKPLDTAPFGTASICYTLPSPILPEHSVFPKVLLLQLPLCTQIIFQKKKLSIVSDLNVPTFPFSKCRGIL